MTIFSGVHAVLYALFQSDEALDFGAMSRQVSWCIDAGCSGITVLGLATEVGKLSTVERHDLVAHVGRAIDGRVHYSVTVAGNSVAEQIALARSARDAGAGWIILQPPMVGNYGAEVYVDFFARVAGAVDLPVALQNAPQYLGRALSAEDISSLRDLCPNVVAVKSEDSALAVRRIVEAAGKGAHILAGRGGLEMTDCLLAGCDGFVLAPDIVPVAARIFALWRKGAEAEAERLYARALPEIVFTMQSLEHLVTYGKRIFAINAGLEVHDRAPCLAPTPHGLKLAHRWARHLDDILEAPLRSGNF